MQHTIVITDTSVLINFLVIDRANLLAALSTHRFVVTDHVRAEITEHYPDQVRRLEQAFGTAILEEISVTDLAEVTIFANLTSQGLGVGECSAIAVAIHRQFTLAMDDRQAIKRIEKLNYQVAILTTEDLMVLLIRANVLPVEEADAIKLDWEQNHRFRLKFNSFRDRL